MTSKLLCDPYVWESPHVLAYTSLWGPNQQACVSEIVNHVVLAALVLGAAGFIGGRMARSGIPLGVAVVAFIVLTLPTLRLALVRSKAYEGFQAKATTSIMASEQPDEIVISSPAATRVLKMGPNGPVEPTARNPFMNVLVDEYKYNPKRQAAMSVLDPNVKVTLDDFFRTEFARDPTDVFGRAQSQRQFVTMPATTIPNDQGSYQNWLYRIPGKTCKEGGREACLPGTDGGSIPWLNADS